MKLFTFFRTKNFILIFTIFICSSIQKKSDGLESKLNCNLPQAKKMIVDSLEGQEELAEEMLIQCIRLEPKKVEPLLELSKFIEKQISEGEKPVYEIHKSLSLISQAFDLDSNNPKIRFLMAHMLSAVGHYEDAQKLYEKTIELFPESKEAYVEKAKLLIENDPNGALNLIKQAIKKGTNSDDVLDILLSCARYKSNLNTFSQELAILSDEFQNRWLYHKLGLVYLDEKKYDDAAKAFQKAIALGNEFESKLQLSIVQYLYLNQSKNAISNFKDLIALIKSTRTFSSASSLSLVYSHYSLALFLTHESDLASEVALDVARMSPDNHEVIKSLVYEYKTRNALYILKPMLRLVIENDPSFGIAYAFLGEIEKQAKNYSVAIKYLEKAIILEPKNDTYYAMIGSVYYKLTQYKKALEFFDLALKLTPSTPLYLYNKACSLALLGNKKEALFYLKIVFNADSNFIEVAKNDKDFFSIKLDKDFSKEFASLLFQNYDGKWASTDYNFKTRP